MNFNIFESSGERNFYIELFKCSSAYPKNIKYIYDGQEVIAELDEDDNTLVRYTHSGMRTDDVLSMNVTSYGVSKGIAQAAGSYFFHKDGLGSVIEITNSSGNIIQHYVYSSFGKILKVMNGSVDNTANPLIKTNFAYTNREYDSESGLYYYRARYYDAHIGRFLQEDPDSGFDKKPKSHINKFIYSLNNPVNMTDPDGRLAWWVIPLAIGLVNGMNAYLGAKDVKGGTDSQIWGSALLGFATGFGAAAMPGGWFMNSLAVGGFAFIQNAGNQLIWNRGTNNYNFGSAFQAAGYSGLANAATFGVSKALDLKVFPGAGILFNSFLGPGDASPSGIPKQCGANDNYSYTYTEGSADSQNQITAYYCN